MYWGHSTLQYFLRELTLGAEFYKFVSSHDVLSDRKFRNMHNIVVPTRSHPRVTRGISCRQPRVDLVVAALVLGLTCLGQAGLFVMVTTAETSIMINKFVLNVGFGMAQQG